MGFSSDEGESFKSSHREVKMSNKKGIVSRVLVAVLVLIGVSFFIGSCSSNTFVVTKDGKSYFFGSNREELYKLICESGDLQKILADTHLSKENKDNLYKYNCIERSKDSKDKIRGIYAAIPPEQRRELRLSFQLHGYDINYMEC